MSKPIVYENVKQLFPLTTDMEIKNRLYVMKVAGWIDVISYSGKDYYFAIFDVDPFDYRFMAGVKDTDSPRRKMEVARALRKAEPIDLFVSKAVLSKRRQVA